MERLRRLSQFWNWLPAFRAVAETEHLPSAAEEIFVGAPALSRAVRLLEQDLGTPLFRRAGRRLELNQQGQQLRDALRDAMHRVYDAVLVVQARTMNAPLNIASAGIVTTLYVIPTVQRLREEHPELVANVRSAARDKMVDQLLRGELDVAFQSAPMHHPELTTTHLGSVPRRIYCGQGHPLYRKRKVSLDKVVEHEFVAPAPSGSGVALDGWPEELPRRCGLFVDQLRVGSEVCAEGQMLAVLPAPIAEQHDRTLRALPLDIISPENLFAIHRGGFGTPTRGETVLAAVQDQISRSTSVPVVSS